MQTLNQDIKERNFKQAYLLCGDEPFLVGNYKKRLREAIAGDDTMNFNYFEGKNPDVREIISLADTMPFFAERRLILIDSSGFFKSAPDELVNYLPQMPDTTCMIFCESEVDKRNKLYKKVGSVGYVAECKRQTGAELKKWAARGFGSYGKKLTEATVELFLTTTGEDMENIRREMEKLVAFVGERDIITSEDVETITTTQISNHIFDMINEVSAGRRERAMALYADLLALKEPPMRILFLLARQFHALLQVKELRELGMDKGEIASKCKLPPFAVGKHMSQASRFSREQLEAYVRAAVEMEQAVKQGNLKDQLAVELLIVTLAGK